MVIRFKFPAGGQVIKVPLTISIPDKKTITDLSESELIINANDNLPLSLGIEVLCDSILSIITASDLVQPLLQISVEQVFADLKIAANDNVPAWVRIDGDIVEAIGMILNAYQSDTSQVVDLVGEDVFENGLTISANDAVDMSASISPNIRQMAGMILSADNGVEIASIRQTLDELSNKIAITEGSKITLIGDLDPLSTGFLDPDVIPDLTTVPVNPYLQVGILEDGEGALDLVIRACDDVQTIKTEPVKIAHIDPNKIGELDPDPVPDGRTV